MPFIYEVIGLKICFLSDAAYSQVSLCIYPPIIMYVLHLSILHLTVHPFIHPLSNCPFIHLSIHPPNHPYIHPSIHPCIHLSIHPSMHPVIHLPFISSSINLFPFYCLTTNESKVSPAFSKANSINNCVSGK